MDCVDRGNVGMAVAEATAEDDPRARFLPAIRATCERIAELVGEALDDGRVPIVLGGDHSIALGTLGGLASATVRARCCGSTRTATSTRPRRRRAATCTACRWPPRSAAAGPASRARPGRCRRVEPGRVAVIGARELDPGERDLIGELGLARATR